MTALLRPSFTPGDNPPPEVPAVQAVIDTLKMQKHVEGGYFVETDRDPLIVPSPFPNVPASDAEFGPGLASAQRPGFNPAVRNASTAICAPHFPYP